MCYIVCLCVIYCCFLLGCYGSFLILNFTVELSCSTGVSYLKLENSYLKLPEEAKKY